MPTHSSTAGLSLGNSVGLGEYATTASASASEEHYNSVIVGGGPAGLLSAIMMAQQYNARKNDHDDGPKIVVYDRLSPPPPPGSSIYSTDRAKYYLLGLGHRGQAALRHFDVFEDVEDASVEILGRRGWAPGKTAEEDGKVQLANKAVTSRVLPRDKLVSVLKDVIEKRYENVVELRYGYQVDPVSFGNEDQDDRVVTGGNSGPPVQLQVSRCIPVPSTPPSEQAAECSIDNEDMFRPTTITTDFLIGTDGAARTIANAMETKELQQKRTVSSKLFDKLRGRRRKPFKVTRYADDNPRVYKSVPVAFPSHWPHDLNYSARSTGNRVTFEALPSDAAGNYCALLLLKPDDDLSSADCEPRVLREFFDAEFPQFSALIDDQVMGAVAKKGASALPSFRYAGPRLHEGGRTVLLGDCVHTVKPYFGLGANTALEDVQLLSNILTTTPNLPNNLHTAVSEFTKQRARDSRALVTLSRGLDRPGKLGTMRFIAPLIVDSMFHKLAPKIFAPGMFGMFQKEGIGFAQIERRKRLDRVMQSVVILSGMSVLGVGARKLVKIVAAVLGIKDVFVGGGLIAMLAAVGVTRRLVGTKER